MRERLLGEFDADDDGVDLFLKIRPTELWVDHGELERNGSSLDDIARFIEGLTATEVARTDFAVPTDRANERVYEIAFPSRVYEGLPCAPS
jgi:hypothetical protein